MPSDDIAILPLPPLLEKLVRRYADVIGLHRVCPHEACRRAKRCATREVMCYQVLREPMNERLRPIVRARLEKEGLLPPSGTA
jgi:hypothetical protein